MKAAWATPGFPRLFVGLAASALGDWMLLLVLGIWVKELTGSSALAGLTIFFIVLPSLIGPLLGMWIDRVRRAPLLIWGNLASAAMVLPLLFVHGPEQVWVIYLVAVFYGFSGVILGAGTTGLIKELVAEDVLVDANAAIQSAREGLRLVGPLAGAGIYGWLGGGAVAIADAVTFIVAAAAVASIRHRQPAPVREEIGVLRELTAGARHIADDLVLRHVLVGFALLLLALGLAESSIYAIVDAFHRPATFVAVVVTVQGVGALVGALLTSRLVRWRGEVSAVVAAMVLMAAGLTVVAVTRSMTVMLVAAAGIGVSIPIVIIAVTTLIQKRTPQQVLGRVSTVTELMASGPQALSMAVGAALVAVVSFRVTFAVMAVGSLLAAGYVAVTLKDRLGRVTEPVSNTAAVPSDL